ncbi:Ig-like domain-containing protein [Cellulomonas soli]|uniref:Ig-like domain-containing protein n=1 Tax=Cellulomonas soli TaxID=931535 RepID=UPI003F8274BE
MTRTRTLAGVLAGVVVATTAFAALATPASANDEGPDVPGQIFLFANTGGFTNPANTTPVTSGTGTVRPFQSLAVDKLCPAATDAVQAAIRIPQAGVPENDWEQVPITAATQAKDAEGRFYTARGDYLTKPQAMTYIASQPGKTGTMPLILMCRNYDGLGVGVIRTTITMTGDATNLTWSVPSPTMPRVASTSTLAVSQTSVEQGTEVTLTATVAPSAATGTVEFFAGSSSLGTGTVTGGTAALTTAALPVGSAQVTAVYSGDSTYEPSTAAAVTVEVSAVAPRSTTTTLTVDPVTGAAYQSVALTAAVASAAGAPTGTVTFSDNGTTLGTVPVTAGVAPVFTTNVLGAGTHSLVAAFTGTAPYTSSTSAAVSAEYTLAGAVHEQTVTVDIPVGSITLTTPYTPSSPLALGTAVLDPVDSTYAASAEFRDIVVTDTRAGNLGWTASVVSSPFVAASGDSFDGRYAGLTGLVATQVPGNALSAADVVLTDNAPYTVGLAAPKVFASYPSARSLGTAHLAGVLGVDQVPSSVAPGLYTATVTLTAV